MRGIVTIVGEGDVKGIMQKIKHRGQDDTQILNCDNLTFGFNRLAINDETPNGMQPFEFKHFIGLFNGEIYNAESLKEKYRIQTKSSCDIEVILPLYEQLGSKVIHCLDGFFSGIIYDKETHQLFLLRDYIGKKPLFIATDYSNNTFIVSELKAIDELADFKIVPKGFSEFRNGTIHLIEQHCISNISKKSLKQVIIDAVKKRIPQNGTAFGVFLSGGLDSSIIASIVANHSDNAIYYTLGNAQDSSYVDSLAEFLGIKNSIRKIDLPCPDELSHLVETIVYHTESYNPSIISNGLATYCLSKAAKNDGLKVVLSGEGADELFCGYPFRSNKEYWFEKREELIHNLHFTELRRLDLASMAQTIEVRCPFLDKSVFAASNDCGMDDLICGTYGKAILRKIFNNDLPQEVVWREKESFDVGSGIRKMVVEYLTQNGNSEKTELYKVWCQHFQPKLANNQYFHSYPTFDKAIERRGTSHRKSQIEQIESLLQREFETIPFHNIFMLKGVKGTLDKGGTCSDKVLHFKQVLNENGIVAKLHSAFINGKECHRLLSVLIDEQRYFIDVGSGWPCVKLLPDNRPITFSKYGMTFKTILVSDRVLLFHQVGERPFQLMESIPLVSMSEEKIMKEIHSRYSDGILYPFSSSIRFSQIIGEDFYFLKENILRRYNDKCIEQKQLSSDEIVETIKKVFTFDLQSELLDFPIIDKIDISVIIATKNRHDFLKERALRSVYSQVLLPKRIVVVDDSDDNSEIDKNRTIIKEYHQSNSVDIYHLPNSRTRGASGSWNTAVSFLLGLGVNIEKSFISIIDDDDEWHPCYLKECSEKLIQNGKNLDMLACDFYRITDHGSKISKAPDTLESNDFLIGNPGIQGSNIFIRLSCFLEAGEFDENLQSCTDRDFCIRIADLGNVRYQPIHQPLMNHYAEANRIRLSTPNSESKNGGLYSFWLKYSKRMTETQKEGFLKRAKKLFNWDVPHIIPKENVMLLANNETDSLSYKLIVGIICSSFSILKPLLTQLCDLQSENFINKLDVVLFENALSDEDKAAIVNVCEEGALSVLFITKQMQDKWLQNTLLNDFSRNRNGLFSIAQARTFLQKYIGEIFPEWSDETIAWILDEDMQINEKTMYGLRHLMQLKKQKIDIVIGKYENSSPNPPINGARVQLIDLWHNLYWLSKQNKKNVLPDFSSENLAMIQKYPDYYYDLSRKHYGHLEHPFWVTPAFEGETCGEAFNRLCQQAVAIFAGAPLTRPLKSISQHSLVESIKDSVNRGGNTFVFNRKALCDVPNLSVNINGTDIRRSDMMWAIINKYYRKRVVKAADIPIWHAGKRFSNYSDLDIVKLREEVLGSVLYATLTEFLNKKTEHELDFSEQDISIILNIFERNMAERMNLLNQSFYRARGIAKSIANAPFDKNNASLKEISSTINNVFSKMNYTILEQNISSFTSHLLRDFLITMRQKSDLFTSLRLK